MKINFFRQRDNVDCGPTCLKIVANYYGRDLSIEYLRRISHLSGLGASLSSVKEAAEEIGFRTFPVDINLSSLIEHGVFPCILYWKRNHFIVLYKVEYRKKTFFREEQVLFYTADPAHGKIVLNREDFVKFWESSEGSNRGFGLFLEPTEEFYNLKSNDSLGERLKSIKFILNYFKVYNRNYIQIIAAMFVSTIIALIFPFLTQSIVDIGIEQKDFGFITVLLLFQIGLFVSNTIVETIRSQLMLHISSRINLSIVKDYLKQLLSLPVSFFESKLISDLVQRVNDNKRIEDFVSSSVINTFFSIVNLIIFSFILFFYSKLVFIVFAILSILSVWWTIFFMEKRRNIDYKRFNELSSSGDFIYEMLGNIKEVKINSYENHMRKEWQNKQINIFKVNIENLQLEQYQQIGVDFFDQLKIIIITFISAYSVINGEMTLGAMLSISYILGQVGSPVKQIITFIKNAQFASIGIERLNEVFSEKKESENENIHINNDSDNIAIRLKDVSFRYGGKSSQNVLKNINLNIPTGKVTAIVGSSGSGKTTLIKLLLKFNNPTNGDIFLNDTNLNSVLSKSWREKCGVVLQEGHIFNDSLKRNIILSHKDTNEEMFQASIKISNLESVIESMPLGVETKLGTNGVKLSTGQKQRVLLARAIYKSPLFLFLDEATNSLDTKNEKEIVEKLNSFFVNRTVVIVAHRLSTVKNADQIVVLDDGEISEVGTHKSLIERKGKYFNLVKNQLELDN
jgi:ATP-binding cassette subfamily B protein